MTNVEDALLATELGADAVGFILYSKSPRYIQAAEAAKIAKCLPEHVLKFCVTVGASLEEMAEIEKVWCPDVWQLHGQESPELVAAMAPRRCVKALGLPWSAVYEPASYAVDMFLLDKASAAYGGTGEIFDWNLALDLKKVLNRSIILSGGLRPNNVVEALRKVQPYGVDVCSGVEASAGKKDVGKLKEFINLCRNLT